MICEFVCAGCGKRAPGWYGFDWAWHKPEHWFSRDVDDPESKPTGRRQIVVCSRECRLEVDADRGERVLFVPILE